jgi:hypothetical protein
MKASSPVPDDGQDDQGLPERTTRTLPLPFSQPGGKDLPPGASAVAGSAAERTSGEPRPTPPRLTWWPAAALGRRSTSLPSLGQSLRSASLGGGASRCSG